MVRQALSRQLLPRKIVPQLGLGFGLGIVLKLGSVAIFLWGNCPGTETSNGCERFLITCQKVGTPESWSKLQQGFGILFGTEIYKRMTP